MFFENHRTKAILIAVLALVAVCAGCGSTTDSPQANSSSSGSSTPATAVPHDADCTVHAPGPSHIDDVLAKVPGFTVDQICPADVDATLGTPAVTAEFLATTAGKVSTDGSAVLSVFVGQLKSDTGDAFVQTFLKDLSSKAAPAKTLATDTKNVGGRDVTYFNIPVGGSGYVYADGPTVVIAYESAGGPKADSAETALSKILANLH